VFIKDLINIFRIKIKLLLEMLIEFNGILGKDHLNNNKINEI
jgi:hypothetical protein